MICAALKSLGLYRPLTCLPFPMKIALPSLTPPPFPQPTAAPSKGPRNILYLTHRFYPEGQGGTEAFLERLATAQQALGSQIHIITLSTGFSWEYPEKIGGILVRSYIWNGVNVLAIRYQRPPSGLYYERVDDSEPFQRDFARWCLAQFHPDLVHAVYPQPFAAFLRVCREASVPYLVTATDFSTICPRGTLMEPHKQLCRGSNFGSRCSSGRSQRFKQVAQMLLGASFFTVPSTFSAERFEAEFPGVGPIVLPHSIDPVFSYRQRTAVRRFAFFGTLTWSKGVFLLVRAFHKLDCDVSLDIYGDGPLHFFLKQYQRLDHRIRVFGQVSRHVLSSCYDLADCVVIPSQTAESYSMVLSEALASGCMVIVSDLGAPPMRAKEAGGKVFRACDPDALYNALLEAIQAPAFPPKPAPPLETETKDYEALYCKVVQQ